MTGSRQFPSPTNTLKMSTRRNAVFFGLIVLLTVLSTMQSNAEVTIPQAEKYLSRFGYLPASVLNTNKANLIDESEVTDAFAGVPLFNGPSASGELDEITQGLMWANKLAFGHSKRPKRNAVQDNIWHSNQITYKISKYPESLTELEVDIEISKAFAVWSEQINITFIPKCSDAVDIEIRFEKLDHGDGAPFDGAGGSLAHAFPPKLGGDIHFDADENWTQNSPNGINLFQVAVHEIGYALGLPHSNDTSTAKFNHYSRYIPNFKLSDDAISAIKSLYNKNLPTPPPRSIAPCDVSKIDTIFNLPDNYVYVFVDNLYYKVENDAVVAGYPQEIRSYWPDLEDNIDAAFTTGNGLTYFFKGEKYWVYKGNVLEPGYPKNITELFSPGGYIDTAFYSRSQKIVMFYKDKSCWTYSFESKKSEPYSDCHWPISKTGEEIKTLDAAFEHTNGMRYLFVGPHYYYYDLDLTSPYETITRWFGCQSKT